MNISVRLLLAALLIGCGSAAAPAAAQIVNLIGSGLNQPQGIAVDRDGNVFVADTFNRAVKKIVVAGGYTTIETLGAANGNFSAPAGIAIDAGGNVFVTDLGNNTVKEILADGGYVTVETLGAANGNFTFPQAVAVDLHGNVFVADVNNDVKEILAEGGYVTVETLPADSSNFNGIEGIAVDRNDNVFVADYGDGAAKEILAASGYATVVQLGLTARLNDPISIALDAGGNVFVMDPGTHAIVEIFAAGGYTSIARIGAGSFSDGTSVAVATDGTLFAADAGATSVQQILPAPPSLAATTVLNDEHNSIGTVAVDAGGDIFVPDGLNQVWELTPATGYQTLQPLPANGGFNQPHGVALDTTGNIFVADTENNAVKEIVAGGGYATMVTLVPTTGRFSLPKGVAVDASGNVFVADTGNDAVKEILASGGYSSVVTLAPATGQFSAPVAVALDGHGNVFVADAGNNAVKEILAAGGYATTIQLARQNGVFFDLGGITVDAGGDVYVTDARAMHPRADGFYGVIKKISASSGYTTVDTIALLDDFGLTGLAQDHAGNFLISDGFVLQKLAFSPALAAAVLPGSRSVQLGTTATLYASIANGGTVPLDNCQIGLADPAPGGLTLDYQTTDPATNAPTGSPDTPVSIAAGASQAFVLGLTGSSAFAAPDMPLAFFCDKVPPAPVIPGVDTVDLFVSATATADVVALAAVATNDGILHVPAGGTGAFAVATVNLGSAGTIAVTAETGGASLPVSLTLCQTNPANGQCLAPPAAAVTVADGAQATPTFSIFAAATGAIPLAPATSRLFVRFTDATGGLRGSTSVAIETQ